MLTACSTTDEHDTIAPEDVTHPCAATVEVVRFGTDNDDGHDEIAEEVPVAMVYNGISHAVMLATPADLEDFALGFSLTEGIVAEPGEIFDCRALEGPGGIELHLEIASRRFVALKDRRRSLAGRTGCGLCGVDSLAALARPNRPLTPRPLSQAAVARALADMPDRQTLRQQTGAVHAAAWADASGHIVAVREDIGRHNALDKLIGWHARQPQADDGFVLVSSRASYEMVQKTISAGIGALIAVSAPTALAVRLATDNGLLLAGLARGQRLVAYSRAGDIVTPSRPG